MEKINEKYYLESNKNNYTLFEKKISETTKKETYKKVGYYTNLEVLYTAIVEKEIRDDLGLIKNMEKVTDLIKDLKESVKKVN